MFGHVVLLKFTSQNLPGGRLRNGLDKLDTPLQLLVTGNFVLDKLMDFLCRWIRRGLQYNVSTRKFSSSLIRNTYICVLTNDLEYVYIHIQYET